MKLLVLCPYPEDRAPSQRFKFEQYYDAWRQAGWELDVRPFWDPRGWDALYREGGSAGKLLALLRGLGRRLGDALDARDADLVYLHLNAVPLGPPVVERLVHQAGVPLVYDIDDMVQLPYSSAANPFMRWLRSRDKPLELMGIADHVVVCTEHLAAVARRHNDAVTNISSTIDTERYRPVAPRDRTEGVVVGWSGSHSTSPYLHLLDDVLQELARIRDVRLRIIGDPGFRMPGVEVEATRWRADTEVEDLSELDIGVYPLPDEEWVLGKSGLKLLQYMGMGLPAVAQRIGTNTEIVEDGVNGLLADTPDEWLEALVRLVDDPELRARLGREGRRTVEARYSVVANTGRYLEVLEDASATRRAGR